MGKHTPGPWEMENNSVHAGGIAVVHHMDGETWSEIWSPIIDFGNVVDEQVYNAHLIKAAPDLLEALEIIATRVEALPPIALKLANDAIRKAKGEG